MALSRQLLATEHGDSRAMAAQRAARNYHFPRVAPRVWRATPRANSTISTAGIITTVAGNGLDFSSSGDAGPARGAQFVTPGAVVTDDSGSVFVVDGARVRKVSANGVISTVAGGGTTDDGDGGPATNANLNLLGC